MPIVHTLGQFTQALKHSIADPNKNWELPGTQPLKTVETHLSYQGEDGELQRLLGLRQAHLAGFSPSPATVRKFRSCQQG